MFKKLKITCDEATAICDKSQYNEATTFEKIQLFFHTLVCKFCSMYVKQNGVLTKSIKKHKNSCKSKHTGFSEADKNTLKDLIKNIE